MAAAKPEEKPEEPVVEEAKLSTVTQTASNAFTAEFTADASKTVTKDNISVTAADGSIVLAVKSVEFSADGKSAAVTVYGNFTDGVSYDIVATETTVPLVATVGDVAKVVINTASAEENVETPISFSLFDATGIDVTPSVALDSYCNVTIEGTYSAATTDKASKATITMNTVGSTADVTVTYNSNAANAEDVTATATITCVDSKAALGNKLFARTWGDSRKVNSESNCAKFYLGLSDSNVTVEVNSTASDVYFCAKDDNGDVINYDSYEVESANNNVASALIATGTDSGKFTQLEITGNDVGSTQLNITAVKNGKSTYYTIPVTVYEVGKAVKMTTTIDKPTMSDVDDDEYFATVRTTLYDAAGHTVPASIDIIETTTCTTGVAINNTATPAGAPYWGSYENKITAVGAEARTHTIKVTAADQNTGVSFSRSLNIAVKTFDKSKASLVYQIEVNRNVVDENPTDTGDDSVTAKLYATCNGLFAGYVRDNSGTIEVAGGTVTPTTTSAINAASMGAIYGNKTYGNDLCTAGAVIDISASNTAAGQTFTAVSNAAVITYGDQYKSETLAKPGTYVITYELQMKDKDGTPLTKTTKKTVSVQVKNTVVIPKVTIKSRTASSLVPSTIIEECMTTDVDMNNNNSANVSIKDLLDSTYVSAVATGTNSDRLIAKYAQVEDKYDTTTWKFYVPVNATFKY